MDAAPAVNIKKLLKEGITDEALRRMARRAGVSATSQKESDDVNNSLRRIAEQILYNLCEKLSIYTEHREAKIVTQIDFRNACDNLRIKLGAYAVPTRPDSSFEKCRSYSPPPGRRTKRSRGELAEKEKKHEERRENCVYNEAAPFGRLVRFCMAAYNRTLKFTPATFSWLQYIVEQILINILTAAGKIVLDTTVGPKGGKPRATLSYRDVAAVLDTLKTFACMPVLENSSHMRRAGRHEESDEEDDDEDDPDDGNKKKSQAKAKGKSKAKAKSKAQAKSKSHGSAKPKAKASAKRTSRKGPKAPPIPYSIDKYSKWKDKGDPSLG